MKAIIIEDEHNSAIALKKMLEQYTVGITGIEIYDTVETGINGIMETRPDVIFLDIVLKNQTAFDLLELLPRPHPQIIFTTAYDQYAIKAIRSFAIDYLLKPISIKELQAAVIRVQQNLQRYGIEKLDEMVKMSTGNDNKLERLAIPTTEGHVFINTDEIIRFEANGSYTRVILEKQPSLLVSRQLKDYEQMLAGSGFVRVHHSCVVNISHIKKYVRGSGGYLLMSDDKTAGVSQSRKENLMKVLRIQ